MRPVIRHISLLVLSGAIACLMTACGPSPSDSEMPAPIVEVHGQPITAAQSSAAPTPGQSVLAVAGAGPVTTQAVPTPAPPPPAVVAASAPNAPETKAASNCNEYPVVGLDKLAAYNFGVLDDAPV